MKRKNEIDEDEISRQARDDNEDDEREMKKEKRQESVAKRKSAKKRDKIARWGGIILLGLIMFVGFLLWVAGEIKIDPTPPAASLGRSGSVIVR